MNRLKTIVANCKAEVSLMINEHRASYEPLIDHMERDNLQDEISADVYKKMIETDTLIDLFIYPDTPIGSYHLQHYDLDEVLNEGIKLMKDIRGKNFINLSEETNNGK